LPNGWNPEGIAISGTDAYVGSLATGGIYQASLITGRGSVLVGQGPGSVAVGLEFDQFGRLWVATGRGAAVYSRSGELLSTYEFGATFANDAIAAHNGVYFTDSYQPKLYFVPFGHGGPKTFDLPGVLGEADAFNNGIEVLPDGRLLIVQMLADRLLTFDPRTSAVSQVNLGGASVLQGDGMVRRGRTLYIVRNFFNTIAKFRLSADGSSASLTSEITDSRFAIPATMDLFGNSIYAVNARFDVDPTPDTTYNIIRVPA
jgi:hypothetical protein